MKEGGNFFKRNNGGVRSGCESFLNGSYQRAGLTGVSGEREIVEVVRYTKTEIKKKEDQEGKMEKMQQKIECR